jgi:hypothetical protein
LKEERKRVFEPTPDFSRRVMSRLKDQPARETLWERLIPESRPAFALALCLLLMLIGIHAFLPVEPAEELVRAYLDPDVSTVEAFLYMEEVPASPDVLEHVMVVETE